MLPYFWRLDRPILSPQAAAETERIVLDSMDQFSPVPRDLTKNIFYSEPIIKNLPIIEKIKSALIYKEVGFVAIMNPPGCSTPRHIDHPSRSTLIYVPITPSVGYSRTLYYDDEISTEPTTVTTYEEMMPVLMNTQIYHGIEYTPVHRVSLQINLGLQIEAVVELWKTGLLFDPEKLPIK